MYNKNLNKLIKISLLSAISVILMFIEIPIVPLFPWLKMDISELPVLMGAFAFGPLTGIVIEGMKIILFFILRGSSTGGVGEIANFLVGVSLMVPASLIYLRNKSKKTAIVGMIVGTIIMELVAIVSNVYFLLPAYGMAMSSEKLIQYVTVGLLPFNAIKSLVVCTLTYLIYKKISILVFNVDSKLQVRKKAI